MTRGPFSRRRLRELIRQSNLIEGITDPMEIEQSLIAWDYLYDWNIPLSRTPICKVQKIITLHQPELAGPKRGYYRNMVQITPVIRDPDTGEVTPCPPWPLVEGMMDNWVLDYEELGPWKAHQRFEMIHPFVDGNGRTGRMLMWWQELKSGGEPTMIRAKDRRDYFKRLRENRT